MSIGVDISHNSSRCHSHIPFKGPIFSNILMRWSSLALDFILMEKIPLLCIMGNWLTPLAWHFPKNFLHDHVLVGGIPHVSSYCGYFSGELGIHSHPTSPMIIIGSECPTGVVAWRITSSEFSLTWNIMVYTHFLPVSKLSNFNSLIRGLPPFLY